MIKPLLIILVPIGLVAFLGERLLRKKFNIEKSGWLYHPVNRLHKRSQVILYIAFILTYLVFSLYNLMFTSYLIFVFLLLLNALRAYMEWKHDRPSKQYIVSIWGCCIFLITIGSLLLFA